MLEGGRQGGRTNPPDFGPALTACPPRFLAPRITRPSRFSDLATCLSMYAVEEGRRSVIARLAKLLFYYLLSYDIQKCRPRFCFPQCVWRIFYLIFYTFIFFLFYFPCHILFSNSILYLC